MSVPTAPQSGEITQMLWALRDGEREALNRLLYAVYPSLRRLAADLVRQHRPQSTIGPTELVHEMLLSLLVDRSVTFENRRHFFACTAQKMRWLLIDCARRRKAARHGGGFQRKELGEGDGHAASWKDIAGLLAIHDLIEKLAAAEPRAAEVLELRYFWGFTSPEVATMVGVSERTVERDWQLARRWMVKHMDRERTEGI